MLRHRRNPLSAVLATLAVLASLSAIPAPASAAPGAAPASATSAAAGDVDKAPSAGAGTRLDYANGCGACRTYREHAPLAWFSLGSLAVGGVFYGIQSSVERSGPGSPSGNGSRMEIAVGAAGLTSLAAGAAYLYFALRGEDDPEARSAQAASVPRPGAGGSVAAAASAARSGFRADVDPAGGVAATFTFPLSLPLPAFGD